MRSKIQILFIVILFISCNESSYIEDYGKIDNSAANKPITKGNIVFYTNSINFNVNSEFYVQIDGGNLAQITQNVSGTPDCGYVGCATIEIDPSVQHTYSAVFYIDGYYGGYGYTWKGTITPANKYCQSLRFSL